MKLDRNVNADHPGKYALVLWRNLKRVDKGEVDQEIVDALQVLQLHDLLDLGVEGTESEFFLIRLKDKYAEAALTAYAAAAQEDDPEWAEEIRALAARSGPNHPKCKRPD